MTARQSDQSDDVPFIAKSEQRPKSLPPMTEVFNVRSKPDSRSMDDILEDLMTIVEACVRTGQPRMFEAKQDARAALWQLIVETRPARRKSKSKTEKDVTELSGYTDEGEPIYWPISSRITVDDHADAWNAALDEWQAALEAKFKGGRDDQI